MPEAPDDNSLLNWLGLRSLPDYARSPLLGGALGTVLLLLLAALMLGGLVALILFLQALFGIGILEGEKTHEAVRNLGIVLAGVLGAPFIVWRTMIAAKSQSVAEQGHITDRISKAVEQLGAEKTVNRHLTNEQGQLLYETPPADHPVINQLNQQETRRPIYEQVTLPNIEVRIGGLYALERIAQDSDRDHIQIMEILCAYIRTTPRPAAARPTRGWCGTNCGRN